MVWKRSGLFFAFAAGLCMLFFGGCGKQKDTKDQATLQGVSLEYWTDRLVKRDYEPAYNREADNASMSFEEYHKLVDRNEKFRFSELKTDKVSIKNDEGTVYVSLKCLVPVLPQPIDRTFKDQWIYQSNQWKHKFSKNQP